MARSDATAQSLLPVTDGGSVASSTVTKGRKSRHRRHNLNHPPGLDASQVLSSSGSTLGSVSKLSRYSRARQRRDRLLENEDPHQRRVRRLLQVFMGLFPVLLWGLFLYVMDGDLEGQRNNNQQHSVLDRFEGRSSIDGTIQGRYILFNGLERKQGFGNGLQGLLAAHLLGLEFNRIVCVNPDTWTGFFLGFRQRYDLANECNQMLQTYRQLIKPSNDNDKNNNKSNNNNKKRSTRPQQTFPVVRIWNLGLTMDECEVRPMLASSDIPLIIFSGDTYPRWPAVPDNDFFHQYYEPTDELLSMLPWKNLPTPPEVVVHLRESDNNYEDPQRRGMDEASLDALGKLLPSSTYLVTNKVELLDTFEQTFGWSHNDWTTVQHSASLHQIMKHWGKRKATSTKNQQRRSSNKKKLDEQQLQTMQLWCDWYTILNAREVYHTESDFSASAIHWANIYPSKVIRGISSPESRELILVEEQWRQTGDAILLRDRPEETLTLRNGSPCQTLHESSITDSIKPPPSSTTTTATTDPLDIIPDN